MKRNIKFRTMLFLTFFLINAFSVSAGTDYYCDFQVNGIYYKFIQDKPNEVAVSYSNYETGRYGGNYSNYTGSITVPSTVTYNSVTYKVTAVTDHAFDEMYSVTSVSLPYTITSIGDYAFADCTKITYMNLPSSLKSIGAGAFDGCVGLTYITIPSSVETIGSSAFQDCQNLSSISIPNSVTSVGAYAFSGTAWYNNLANGIIYVGKVAYAYKGTVPTNSSIVLQNGTVSINDYAFNNHTGLVSVSIPSSVTNIGYRAFNSCSNLASITLLGDHVNIDSYAFSNTAWLNNQPDGMVYIGKTAYTYKGTMPVDTKIEIKEGTTAIAGAAFNGFANLSSVTIPQTVLSIGNNAFGSAVKSVTVKRKEPMSISRSSFYFDYRWDNDDDKYYYSSNMILYVPANSKVAYEAAPIWQDFKEIIEMDSEIDDLEDAIYVAPFTAFVDRDENIEICLKNSQQATAYNFDMVLPEGITVAVNDKGKYLDALSNRHNDHTRTFNDKGGNTYSFATLSGNSESLTGNDGAIRLVTIHVDETVAEGDYSVYIRNASYSKPDGTLISFPDTKMTFRVEECLLGDVNGNGGVDIGDAVTIVNYLVGKESTTFVAKAADTNKNGQIDIGDAVTIVNYLVGKTESLSRQTKGEETEREAD